jgi:hypothetical protein
MTVMPNAGHLRKYIPRSIIAVDNTTFGKEKSTRRPASWPLELAR